MATARICQLPPPHGSTAQHDSSRIALRTLRRSVCAAASPHRHPLGAFSLYTPHSPFTSPFHCRLDAMDIVVSSDSEDERPQRAAAAPAAKAAPLSKKRKAEDSASDNEDEGAAASATADGAGAATGAKKRKRKRKGAASTAAAAADEKVAAHHTQRLDWPMRRFSSLPWDWLRMGSAIMTCAGLMHDAMHQCAPFSAPPRARAAARVRAFHYSCKIARLIYPVRFSSLLFFTLCVVSVVADRRRLIEARRRRCRSRCVCDHCCQGAAQGQAGAAATAEEEGR
jgi:hypothetical protein